MRNLSGLLAKGVSFSLLAVSLLSVTQQAMAQAMPDIGFDSVGRGDPIADAQDYETVGPLNFFGFDRGGC